MTSVNPSGLSLTSAVGTLTQTVSEGSGSLVLLSIVGRPTGYLPLEQRAPPPQVLTTAVGNPVANPGAVPSGLQLTLSFGAVGGLVSRPGFGLTGFNITDDLSIISDNSVSLTWSTNGGQSWSNPVMQSIGFEGEFWRSVSFQGVGGLSRNMVYRLSWSCPFDTSLQGAFIRYEAA